VNAGPCEWHLRDRYHGNISARKTFGNRLPISAISFTELHCPGESGRSRCVQCWQETSHHWHPSCRAEASSPNVPDASIRSTGRPQERRPYTSQWPDVAVSIRQKLVSSFDTSNPTYSPLVALLVCLMGPFVQAPHHGTRRAANGLTPLPSIEE
jgi:hypothetical protein